MVSIASTASFSHLGFSLKLLHATYDARHAAARMDKFGRTSSKLNVIMNELLENVNRAPPGAGARRDQPIC